MTREIVIDVVAAVGFGLLIEGVRRIYPPAAFMVAGSIMLAAAVLASRGGGEA